MIISMETNILLESGTNELELLEFFVGDKDFGINIAKVSEIMTYREATPMPSSPPEVEGVFMPRDKLITIVDLHKVLNIPQPEDSKGLLIVCQFNQMDIAFHVTSVMGIQRISWANIEKPPTVANNSNNGIATGIAKVDTGIIIVLDFEKIITDLNCSAGLDVEGLDKFKNDDEIDYSRNIVIAEDSPFLNKMIVDTLNMAGYKNVISFANGQEAWNYISNVSHDNHLLDHIALLITDIEMPQMDGHRLTKLIKDDSYLRQIPIFLFSSLIDEKMRLKGETVGADEQFSKPQINTLVETLPMYLKQKD